MSPIQVLFVDKGGVLVDNSALSVQWRRLIGEYLAPRLGGRHEKWGEANLPAFQRQWERFQRAAAAGGPADIRGFFAKDARQWFLDMCDGVGVDRPSDDVADTIAADTVNYDGLVELLERIGGRDLFDRVYGSDLVKTWKFGPDYYRAVLADSGVDPARAAVVDDSPQALAWARECGLRGFLVERRDGEGFDDAVARTFEDVARAID